MGVAETVPGVSGGTVALVLGVYEHLIDGAGHVLSAVRSGVAGRRHEAQEHLRRVHWATVVPVAVGMVVAVVLAAQVVEPLVTDHPVGTRAVFFGLVLGSIAVPAMMVRDWRAGTVGVAVVAAVVAFLLSGLPPGGEVQPALPVVALAAAVAICALVLPGVSGSFFLLTVGLYQPTLAAVNDRDLVYLLVFALGALVGLASFVKVLQWALLHHHAVVLAGMSGLMAGSLRALWPWQDEDRGLLPPDDGALPVVALAVGALLLVAATVLLQRRYDTPAGSTGTERDDTAGRHRG
ncbi:DUF368 domain-containing protein [Klenkia sp. LSe6-5]|uniref:DUF368 domain-containing protein n=1 Tax=Klenkia sesuvii TaxID=3103137 RepID=A0ABU8DQ24_9ACTN